MAESLQPRSLEVIELNLEDAFIEYTRGPRRALPILAGEPSDAESDAVQGAA
jgi:ABC-2 type transport system ATP-binding protein